MGVRSAVFSMVFAAGMGAAAAQTPAGETLSFPSLTMSDSQFLQGDKAAASEVTLTGRLRLPEGDGPFPAVILLHGSDGPKSALAWNWARVLGDYGVASFAIDSYTARGHEEIFSGQARVGEFNNVIDTFEALRLLAADPRIDAGRIAVMGFSRGGIPALYSAMTRFEDLYAPEGLRLAAHLPFYPPCNFRLDRELEVGPEPIRAFHGEADVWNPLPRCKDYVERLAAAGHDATISTYPGAHHAFDHPGSPSYNVKETAQTSRRCMRVEEDGVLINEATGEPFAWTDACVELGPAVQYNGAAADGAAAEIRTFLSGLFRLE